MLSRRAPSIQSTVILGCDQLEKEALRLDDADPSVPLLTAQVMSVPDAASSQAPWRCARFANTKSRRTCYCASCHLRAWCAKLPTTLSRRTNTANTARASAGKARPSSHSKKPPRRSWSTSSKTRKLIPARSPTIVRRKFLTSLLCLLTAHARNLCAIHGKRVTVMKKDFQLARRLRGRWDGLGGY
ncbi:hypothetical protein Golomagni_07129 [Golovinomyces magnicellulatus]|nr:hypothetical protein Golomagni_07129 [Golovinomyces magnicellulatus]